MINQERFEMEYDGERFIFETHIQNPAHEARIRWKAVNQKLSGKWGRLYLPDSMEGGTDQTIREPKLVLGEETSVNIEGEDQNFIRLPRSLAAQLQNALTEIGTAIVDSPPVCDEPSCFPSRIEYQTKISAEHLDKVCWDSDRYIMWYSANKPSAQNVPPRVAELISQLDTYGYQITNGKLVHRTAEYPSNQAVDELKRLFEKMAPDSDTERDTDSYRVDERLR